MQKQESKPIQSLSFEELFQMAEEKYEQLDYDEAQYFYGQAYSKNAFNEAVVMCYANLLKQNGKAKQAKKVLQKSIKQNPKGTYKRYFQLGEIYDGVQAIKSFQAGINEAFNHLKNPFKSVTPQAQIKRDISQAYASIAEICMTDLIDEPQAEVKCIQALQKGKSIDQKCMDVHLHTANYQLFKENFDVALKQLCIILNAVTSKQQEYENQLILQASKYFIQLDEFSKSAQLLQTIHQEQSNESQIVYLLAYCAFKSQKYQECQDYIEEYKDGENNIKDQQIQEAMAELVVELAKVRKHNNGKPSNHTAQNNNDAGDFNEDDEWMDVEDEEN